MSAQQAVHIILSLPLNTSSRNCIFVNTSPIEHRAFVLKKQKELEREPDESEDIMCPSIIDYYVLRPKAIENICLAEFASSYTRKGRKRANSKKPYIIRFVKYNKHKDRDNYYREKLMLYVPYRQDEQTFKEAYSTWEHAYNLLIRIIEYNEKKFVYETNATWGDFECATNQIETKEEQLFKIQISELNEESTKCVYPTSLNSCQEYNFDADLQHFQSKKNIKLDKSRPYHIVKQPNILENAEFFAIRRQLNQEQARIVKDVLRKKKCDPNKPIHLFLTGGAGTGKTFTAKAIFQSLVRYYNAEMDYDPLQLKGLITAYTGKAAFNAGGVTLHFAFYMPFNKSNYLPLNSEKLDTLTKHFQQLRVLLIDEASLIGATFLYEIDKRLRKIKHTPTFYFGGIDIIFCGDLYQAQPIKDSFIFEEPTINNHKTSYSFWQDEVKCYQLHITMRQKNIDFIRILNKMRLNKQSDEDIEYINAHCYRAAPIDPLFPYLFYRNKDVNEHNDRMLSIVNGQLVILEAIDEVENYQDTLSYYEKTIALPIKILVKQNMLVELCAGNYNIEDGLVNGADGVFKKYTRKTKDIDII